VGRRLDDVLADHSVIAVPGFLATRADGAVVSLGRGGSLSAVLVAIGLEASCCELLKDVPGYFEQDPRENERACHPHFLLQKRSQWRGEVATWYSNARSLRPPSRASS